MKSVEQYVQEMKEQLRKASEEVAQRNQETLQKHFEHPFYKRVDEITDEVAIGQIVKGAEKYNEPFTPSNWTGKELARHALEELRDGQVYVVGLLDHIERAEAAYNNLLSDYNALGKLYQLQAERIGELEKELAGRKEKSFVVPNVVVDSTGFDAKDIGEQIKKILKEQKVIFIDKNI